MAESAGRNLKLKDGSVVIASIKTKSVSINSEVIDISTDDSAGWRTLMSVPGQKSIDISFDGISKDSALKEKAASMTDISYAALTVEFPDGSTLIGKFILASLEESGTYNDAVTFSGSLQSSGTIAESWLP